MSDTSVTTTGIILFPDFEMLREEVAKLRTELSTLFLERDALIYHECKNIEMAYMLAVGAMEYKAFELECSIRRQKRKIELIQAKINRQEPIQVSQIDAMLDKEFAQYQLRLKEQIEKMNAALERSHGALLTDEESLELKKLYRSIVKALHPDLHPDLSDEKAQLFLNAMEAYEHGDINALRMIDCVLTDSETVYGNTDGITALVKEKERLSSMLQSIKDRIAEIKSEFPYIMKEFVQSPAKIDARKAELQDQIDRLSAALAGYDEKIRDMLR